MFDLVIRGGTIVVAWRDHGHHGQLWRRLRAGAAVPEGYLIDVMEGVEDIPGSALAEGMPWDWETFPEYLDSIDRFPRSIDVAAQVPHCAIRAYVMGRERALDDATTPDDVAQMAEITREAIAAGAVGFSTSRTFLHHSKSGELIPGTHSDPQDWSGSFAAWWRGDRATRSRR